MMLCIIHNFLLWNGIFVLIITTDIHREYVILIKEGPLKFYFLLVQMGIKIPHSINLTSNSNEREREREYEHVLANTMEIRSPNWDSSVNILPISPMCPSIKKSWARNASLLIKLIKVSHGQRDDDSTKAYQIKKVWNILNNIFPDNFISTYYRADRESEKAEKPLYVSRQSIFIACKLLSPIKAPSVWVFVTV